MTPLEVLRGARELLSDPKRWTKGRLKKSFADGTYCFCLIGATCEVAKEAGGFADLEADEILNSFLGELDAAQWNDAPERTHAEVLALLDRAIAKAESEAVGV